MPRSTSDPTVALPLWWDAPSAGRQPGGASGPITLPASVDVCVVGGGFTGLWTAYYLLCDRPDLEILVLEAEHAGFGASGRNGGWVSALWPVGLESIAARHGRGAALAMLAALCDTVDEVGRAAADEGIDCGFAKGGMIAVARNEAQALRAKAYAAHGASWGDGTTWLGAAQAREHLAASHVHGGTFNPNCARIQPRLLADGLAAAVRRRGATIAEGRRVATASPGRVVLSDGVSVRARHVIRATEAWTARLPGLRRRIAPVYSLMVATEPMTARTWDEIGLSASEVFTDHRHVVVYGQRTVDNRVAFGGRGAPYHLGSAIRPDFDRDERVFAALRAALVDLLPQLDGVQFSHAWGGPLGIARDWSPAVGYDAAAGVGWAGGYVGDGVAATNLAGRTLSDLIAGRDTPLTRLPWVGHRSPAWEPEPLRWLGVNAGLRLAGLADREESATGRPARLGWLLSALTGH
jgi:glycine/D-amino acid oxidase-like deaminating enzyme